MSANQLTSAYAHKVYSDAGLHMQEMSEQWGSVWQDSGRSASADCEKLKERSRPPVILFPVLTKEGKK